MNILVVGAGMYVTGRGGSGVGTILSSLAETSKTLNIGYVLIVAKNTRNESIVADAARRINTALGTALNVRYQCIEGDPLRDISKLCEDTKFDCAIISLPDHLHFAYTKELFKQGVHCLVVKPLTPSLTDAKELVRMQAKTGLYGAVEFHKRLDETNLYIKKILTEKRLGKLIYFTIDYSQKISIPTDIFREWSDKTNIFQYLGVHYVDLIFFLTGFLPVRAMAIGTDGILKSKNIPTFDSVHATIVWQNTTDASERFVSLFSTNWIDPLCTSAMSDQKYKVIGTKGRIECDQKNRGLELVHEEQGIQQINPYFSEYLFNENGSVQFGGYGHRSINRFLSDVEDLKNNVIIVERLEKSRPTFKQSLVATAVIDAVNKSLSDNFSWKDINDIF
jgi:predicted dehydrogenase